MPPESAPIDEWMDRASVALEATEYFEAERLCAKGARRARAAGDFERLARICLPLQESRRQIRQLAESAGVRAPLSRSRPIVRAGDLEPGCYLLQPPMLGVDAGAIRDAARRRRVPVMVLAREPMTAAGLWPIVAVGESSSFSGPGSMFSVRVRVAPPPGVVFTDRGPTRDDSSTPPPLGWFTSAGEALGDAAIARIQRDLPAAWRVDDLLDALDAIPDHEKLHQRLADACKEAAKEPPPTATRRPRDTSPWSF